MGRCPQVDCSHESQQVFSPRNDLPVRVCRTLLWISFPGHLLLHQTPLHWVYRGGRCHSDTLHSWTGRNMADPTKVARSEVVTPASKACTHRH